MQPEPRPVLVVRNYKALFPWGFMALWMLFLALFTHVMFRDMGAPRDPGSPFLPLILGLFWIVGLGTSLYVFSHPLVRLEVFPDGHIRVTRRWPHRRDEWQGTDVVLRLKEDKDSEGDPYFEAQALLPGPLEIGFHEGSHRPDVEAALESVRAALARPRSTTA